MSVLSVGPGERIRARFRSLGVSPLRPILMIGVPALVIAAAAAVWLLGGRYVSTDNTYVKAAAVSVSSEVGGRIVKVFVTQNQHVAAGEKILQIDPEPYRIALSEAEAQLAQAAANVRAMQARYHMTTAQLELAKSNIDYYGKEYERQRSLARNDFASQAKLDEAKHNYDTATQLSIVLGQSIAEIAANLDGMPEAPVERHSAYMQAKAVRDRAALNLKRATLYAPFGGVLGLQPQVGDHVAPGTPIVSLISDDKLWVEANFKETQLTDVHVGQKARITIDTYPGRTWEGHVESIAQGTGAEFSILPAQNSTGNWVKVVQRIPVRIAIDRAAGDPAIRAGMSSEVEIDTASNPRIQAAQESERSDRS